MAILILGTHLFLKIKKVISTASTASNSNNGGTNIYTKNMMSPKGLISTFVMICVNQPGSK